MKEGGCLEREESAAAHSDHLTKRLAELLATEGEPLLIEFVSTALMLGRAGLSGLFSAYERRLHPTQAGALAQARDVVGQWLETLSAGEIADRKGALLERIVQRLLSFRLPKVQRECRVTFTDGSSTAPFDVLGTSPADPWEAVECKWSLMPDVDQAAELRWAARQSLIQEGGRLTVAIASTATRALVEPNMRTLGLCDDVRFVSAETLLQLGSGAAYQPCD